MDRLGEMRLFVRVVELRLRNSAVQICNSRRDDRGRATGAAPDSAESAEKGST